MNTELDIDKTISPGETVAGVQLCPFGNFPGEKKMQVCDRRGFDQVIADWKANGSKEILMDFEHQSEVDRIDSDTKAAAWITNLRVDDTLGLLGDLKFTDKGAEAVAYFRDISAGKNNTENFALAPNNSREMVAATLRPPSPQRDLQSLKNHRHILLGVLNAQRDPHGSHGKRPRQPNRLQHMRNLRILRIASRPRRNGHAL